MYSSGSLYQTTSTSWLPTYTMKHYKSFDTCLLKQVEIAHKVHEHDVSHPFIPQSMWIKPTSIDETLQLYEGIDYEMKQ